MLIKNIFDAILLRFFLLASLIVFAVFDYGFALQPGNPMPEKLGTNLEGRVVFSQDFPGKTLVIFEWSSYDKNVDINLSSLEKFYKDFKGYDIEVIAVNYNPREQRETVAEYAKNHQLTYTTLIGDLSTNDGSNNIIIVNKFGIIHSINPPIASIEALRRLVTPILKSAGINISSRYQFGAGEYVYVAVSGVGNGCVIVVKTKTGEIVDYIRDLDAVNRPIGKLSSATDVLVSPDGKYLYVLLYPSSISKLETSTNTPISTIDIKSETGSSISSITGMVISPNGRYLYLACEQEKSVCIVNVDIMQLEKFIKLQSPPGRIAISPNGKYIYVKGYVIDTDKQAVTNKIDGEIVAVSSDGRFGYGIDIDNQSIDVFDLTQDIKLPYSPQVGTGNDPFENIMLSSDGRYIYVSTGEVLDIQQNGMYVGEFKEDDTMIGVKRGVLYSEKNYIFGIRHEKKDIYIIDAKTFKVVKKIPAQLSPEQDMQGIAILPDAFAFVRAKAIDLYNAGKYDEAMLEFNKFLKNYPQDVNANLYIGRIYLAKNQIKEALEKFKFVLSIDPNNAELHLEVGRLYIKQGQIQDAIKEFNASLSIDPKQIRVYEELGKIYFKQGQLTDAINAFKKVVSVEPDNADVHEQLAKIYIEQKDWQNASIELKEVLRVNPRRIPIRENLVKAYLSLGKTDLALEEIKIILEQDPKNLEFRKKLANMYLEAGNVEQAINEFQEVIKAEPDTIKHYEELVQLYTKAGRIDGAISAYEKIVELKPDRISAMKELASLYATRNIKLLEAEKLMNKVITMDPFSKYEYLGTLGWIHYKQGRRDEAVKELAQAIERTEQIKSRSIGQEGILNPILAEHNYRLGQIYLDSGDNALAQQHLGTAVALNPSAPWADDTRKTVDKLKKSAAANKSVYVSAQTLPNGKKKVSITYKDETAKSVNLVGSFNNWDQTATPMLKIGGVWRASLELDLGKYLYKFWVDGSKWVDDPLAEATEDDPAHGGKSGVFNVTEAGSFSETTKSTGCDSASITFDTPPKPKKVADLIYPSKAREAKVEGTVYLQACIDVDGTVKDLKLLKGIGFGCDESAMESVRKWIWEPATLQGKPVRVLYTVQVPFKR